MMNPYFFCNNLSSISHTNKTRNKAKYLQIVNLQKLACKKAWGGGYNGLYKIKRGSYEREDKDRNKVSKEKTTYICCVHNTSFWFTYFNNQL